MQNNPTRHDTGKVYFRKVMKAVETSVAMQNGFVIWQPQAGQVFSFVGGYTKTTKIVSAAAAVPPVFNLDNGVTANAISAAVTAPATVDPVAPATTPLFKKIAPAGELVFDADHPLRLNLTTPAVVTDIPAVPPSQPLIPKEFEVEVIIFAVPLGDVQS